MPAFTPNRNLYLPGGGSLSIGGADEVADIDRINQNFQSLDTWSGEVDTKFDSLEGQGYYVGTDADRLSLLPPVLRNGIRFQTSDTRIEWVRLSDVWVQRDRPSVSSGVFTAASGWSVQAQRATAVSGIIYAQFSVERTGGTINVNTQGDLANTQIGTTTEDWTAFHVAALHSGDAGRVASGYTNSSGGIYLAAVGGSANITNGDSISLGGTYPMNRPWG